MSWTTATGAATATATGTATAHRPTTGLRLTRRGRVVVLLALITLLFAAFSLGRVGSQAAPRSTHRSTSALTQTVVHQGESLWSVARRVAPQDDPRDVVAQLEQLNDIPDAEVQAGQLLVLPRG